MSSFKVTLLEEYNSDHVTASLPKLKRVSNLHKKDLEKLEYDCFREVEYNAMSKYGPFSPFCKDGLPAVKLPRCLVHASLIGTSVLRIRPEVLVCEFAAECADDNPFPVVKFPDGLPSGAQARALFASANVHLGDGLRDLVCPPEPSCGTLPKVLVQSEVTPDQYSETDDALCILATMAQYMTKVYRLSPSSCNFPKDSEKKLARIFDIVVFMHLKALVPLLADHGVNVALISPDGLLLKTQPTADALGHAADTISVECASDWPPVKRTLVTAAAEGAQGADLPELPELPPVKKPEFASWPEAKSDITVLQRGTWDEFYDLRRARELLHWSYLPGMARKYLKDLVEKDHCARSVTYGHPHDFPFHLYEMPEEPSKAPIGLQTMPRWLCRILMRRDVRLLTGIVEHPIDFNRVRLLSTILKFFDDNRPAHVCVMAPVPEGLLIRGCSPAEPLEDQLPVLTTYIADHLGYAVQFGMERFCPLPDDPSPFAGPGSNYDLKMILPYEDLYPYQKQIVDEMEMPVNDRTVTWVWNGAGNIGKSWLAKYLSHHFQCILVGGKDSNMKHAIAKAIEVGGLDAVIVDLPRSRMNYTDSLYGTLEDVKNALFFSGKYESGQVMTNPPRIYVFANQPPKPCEEDSGWSADRYDVRNVSEGPFEAWTVLEARHAEKMRQLADIVAEGRRQTAASIATAKAIARQSELQANLNPLKSLAMRLQAVAAGTTPPPPCREDDPEVWDHFQKFPEQLPEQLTADDAPSPKRAK